MAAAGGSAFRYARDVALWVMRKATRDGQRWRRGSDGDEIRSVGYRPLGREDHAAAVAAHPEAELVAVWGRDLKKARAVAAPYGAAAYDDLETALSDVDAVAIAVPPDVQATLAVQAATAGKHLLLEKPLALRVGAADDVVRAAAAGGVASVVFFTSRYVPEVDAFLPEAVAAGFGAARVTMLGSILGDDNPYRDSVWRYEYGGLWDLGPHALSLLLPVLGPIIEVSATAAPHGVTHVIATHVSGSVSTMALSVVSPSIQHEFVFTGPDRRRAGPGKPSPADRTGSVARRRHRPAARSSRHRPPRPPVRRALRPRRHGRPGCRGASPGHRRTHYGVTCPHSDVGSTRPA